MDKITVQQIVNILIGLGGIVGTFTTLASFFYVALFRPFRNFLRKEIVSSLTNIDDTLKRTETQLLSHINNPLAHTLGEYRHAESTQDGTRSESSIS